MEFDREIVECDVTKSKDVCERKRQIKDAMRGNVVPAIAQLLQQVIESQALFHSRGADRLVARALEVMEKVMDWTSLDLFLHNLPQLVFFLQEPQLQTPSAKCLFSIISKGMEPMAKLHLLEKLNLTTILTQWQPAAPGQDEAFGQTVSGSASP